MLLALALEEPVRSVLVDRYLFEFETLVPLQPVVKVDFVGAGACVGWLGEEQLPLGLTLGSLSTARRVPSALPAPTGCTSPSSTATRRAARCVPWPGTGPPLTSSPAAAPAATSAPSARRPPTRTSASPDGRHRRGGTQSTPWVGAGDKGPPKRPRRSPLP